MTSTRGDELVGLYMGRLGAALAGVPADRRDEIVGEIAAHIAEQRASVEHETDDDVEKLLARVGDPEELAAAATAERSTEPRVARRIGAVEVLALVLTLIVWPVGVILLWLSPAWSNRDKLIGTVLTFGGYPTILFFGPVLFLWPGLESTCSGGSINGQPIAQTCTGVAALPGWEQVMISVAVIGAALLVLVMPVLVGIYLAMRLRRWASTAALAAA